MAQARLHQLPQSVPLSIPSSETEYIATSHKGWPLQPSTPFPTNSKASVAVFEKKDELLLTKGWSLIKGEDETFFLGLEDVYELRFWNEDGM
jgi:hypothetical protein